MTTEKSQKRRGMAVDVTRRIVICVLVLLFGVGAMTLMIAMKQPPAEAVVAERPLRVTVTEARPRDVPVTLTGYGSVRPLEVVAVAPEVSGTVTAMHPELKVGGIVPADTVLFAIDPRDYRIALDEARAMVAQLRNRLSALERQSEFDRERLATLARNRELARIEFDRVRNLFQQDRVGTQSGVDGAERAYNTIRDQTDQLIQAVALYPARIAEARAALAAAEARETSSVTNLARCQVRMPFHGRVTHHAIQVGQFVNRGVTAVTLANDSLLEIHVPLDSRDARQWLQFQSHGPSPESAWFGRPTPVEAAIRWTEENGDRVWRGSVHRVVRFSEDTRTLTVAVRIPASRALPVTGDGFPLVEGMFCRVDIPGRTMPGVVPLPRWAVSFDDSVYLAVNGRLKTMPVRVARIEGETAFVASGLNPGDRVIDTRLVDPLENSLLEIIPAHPEDAAP